MLRINWRLEEAWRAWKLAAELRPSEPPCLAFDGVHTFSLFSGPLRERGATPSPPGCLLYDSHRQCSYVHFWEAPLIVLERGAVLAVCSAFGQLFPEFSLVRGMVRLYLTRCGCASVHASSKWNLSTTDSMIAPRRSQWLTLTKVSCLPGTRKDAMKKTSWHIFFFDKRDILRSRTTWRRGGKVLRISGDLYGRELASKPAIFVKEKWGGKGYRRKVRTIHCEDWTPVSSITGCSIAFRKRPVYTGYQQYGGYRPPQIKWFSWISVISCGVLLGRT